MASHGEQDLLPEQTEGFKVGEKKTIDEYKNMGMLTKILYVTSHKTFPHSLASRLSRRLWDQTFTRRVFEALICFIPSITQGSST